MNVSTSLRVAREFLRNEFIENKGLKINGKFYQDLDTFRKSDKIAYKSLLDVLVWGDKISYDFIVHPERLQARV